MRMRKVQQEIDKIGNVKIGNAEVGRMEWPFSATVIAPSIYGKTNSTQITARTSLFSAPGSIVISVVVHPDHVLIKTSTDNSSQDRMVLRGLKFLEPIHYVTGNSSSREFDIPE